MSEVHVVLVTDYEGETSSTWVGATFTNKNDADTYARNISDTMPYSVSVETSIVDEPKPVLAWVDILRDELKEFLPSRH